MILSSESHAKPVIHVIHMNQFAAALEQYPYPTPVFIIERLPTDGPSHWRVQANYDVRFTENMKQRSDVLGYMIQAQAFVDTTDISTVRDTVTRLLVHWSKLFPQGIPDSVM